MALPSQPITFLYIDGVSLAQTSGSLPTMFREHRPASRGGLSTQSRAVVSLFLSVLKERLSWKYSLRKPPKQDSQTRECPFILTSTLYLIFLLSKVTKK